MADRKAAATTVWSGGPGRSISYGPSYAGQPNTAPIGPHRHVPNSQPGAAGAMISFGDLGALVGQASQIVCHVVGEGAAGCFAERDHGFRLG